MSVTTETNRTAELVTDGVETEFDFGLGIDNDSELEVFYEVTGGSYTQLTLDTDYTVVFTEDGGTITTIGGSSPYAAGKILIIRHLPLTQQANWLYNDNHTEKQHQDDFDRACKRDIQIQEKLDRAVGFAIHSSTKDIDFPEPLSDNIIGWNTAATALENKAGVTGFTLLPATDGNFIVGDGTNWVAESGNTARTSLGLGTGDSPTFTGLNLSGLTAESIPFVGADGVLTEDNTNFVWDGSALLIGGTTHRNGIGISGTEETMEISVENRSDRICRWQLRRFNSLADYDIWTFEHRGTYDTPNNRFSVTHLSQSQTTEMWSMTVPPNPRVTFNADLFARRFFTLDFNAVGDGTEELDVSRMYHTFDHTNVTGSGTIVLQGDFSHAANHDYKIEITTGGDVSGQVAKWRWSDDGGSNWNESDIDVTYMYDLNNGLFLQFNGGAGTDFNANDYVTWTAIGTANRIHTLVADTTNTRVGIGATPVTTLTVEGAITLKEQAEADGNTAAYGQIWVNTASPNELWFTDDEDNDYQLAPLAAHKDSHDPEDGSDALDTANASELANVQAAGTGTSHSFARADHAHQIQHAITDNHIVTVDGTANDDEYARFTASGLEGRTEAEFKGDFSLEIGTDVQAYDAGLASLAGLTYAAASFVKMTGANTFALRTIGETADDLEGTIDHDAVGGTITHSSDNLTPASVTLPNTGLHLLDTNASHDLVIAPGSDLTADRTLTITTGDAARTVTLSGNPTLSDWFDQSVKQAANPTFANLTLTAALDMADAQKIEWANSSYITCTNSGKDMALIATEDLSLVAGGGFNFAIQSDAFAVTAGSGNVACGTITSGAINTQNGNLVMGTGDITCDDITCDDIICEKITASDQIVLNQSADSVGLAIIGYDDMNGENCELYIDSSGNTRLVITERFIALVDNYILLDAGDNIYLDLGDAAGAKKVIIRDSANATVAEIDSDGAAAFDGCVTDGTCWIFKGVDALSVIKDVMELGDGTIDDTGYEHMDLKAIKSKYPFLIHKSETLTDMDGGLLAEPIVKYYDKLGAKSDLLYKAVLQLEARLAVLEAA